MTAKLQAKHNNVLVPVCTGGGSDDAHETAKSATETVRNPSLRFGKPMLYP
jgi:hypothetical protein